jgi:general secretion pathway protein H
MKTLGSDRSGRGSRRGAPGFTLLELLIVLALVGLGLAAVGNLARAPSGADELAIAVRSVGSALETARARAIRSGRPATVEIDPEAAALALVPGGRVLRLGEGVVLSASVAREASEDGTPRILFFPDGTSTGGRLTVANAAAERTIIVHWLTGTVHDAE